MCLNSDSDILYDINNVHKEDQNIDGLPEKRIKDVAMHYTSLYGKRVGPRVFCVYSVDFSSIV